jgi:hypothetical protein
MTPGHLQSRDRKGVEEGDMRQASALPQIPPHLIVMAIADAVAPQQTPRPAAHVERLVRFGDWRDLIASQIAHPEQLRDDHLLRCEILLARIDEQRSGFGPMDAAAAQRLSLPMLPAQFSLKLLEDPTQAAPKRTLIPERYRRPWEFQMSRREAIARANEGARPGIFKCVQRLCRRRATRRALDRWQGQLDGKAPADQLWSVRPPQCAFQQKKVREWVGSILAHFGWDPVRGTREWEIFWRRKGV